ncbi:MAG TPA: hypothetical protein VHC22_07305 [Pirellulales bacterium]|nr:hypothetical protein [Pirellulales bacterium]
MLRHSLKAALVAVALTSLVQDAHASNHRRLRAVAKYLFGDFGPGPFGHGYFPYAGYPPYKNPARNR